MWWLFVVLGPFVIVPLAFLLFLELFGLMILLTFEVVPKILVRAWRWVEKRAREWVEKRAREKTRSAEMQEEEALWQQWREIDARRKNQDRSHRI